MSSWAALVFSAKLKLYQSLANYSLGATCGVHDFFIWHVKFESKKPEILEIPFQSTE